MSQDLLRQKRKEASAMSLGLSHAAIYEKLISSMEKLNLSGKILDYGAGQGRLTRKLHELGRFAEVTGIDLMARPADLDTGCVWKRHDLNEALPEWKNRFDVIVAAEVIEHLENPRATVRACFEWLKPGGYLLMSTPNNESWRALLALIARGHFVEFLDNSYPAHITALLAKDLVRIFSECGFAEVRVEYTDHGSLPRLTRYRWQNLSKTVFRGKRYSDNMVVMGRKSEA